MGNENALGRRIAFHRKKNGYTQEELAAKVGVSSQAVSKWEQQVNCPDIMLLPKLACIFGTSVDDLFGLSDRADALCQQVTTLPWSDDGRLRIALFSGQKLISQNVYSCPEGESDVTFRFRENKTGYRIDGTCHLICLPEGTQ